MAKKIESTRNTYDDPNTPLRVTLNAATYTDIFSANEDRLGYKVTNDSPHDILIKEKASANPDSADRGFGVGKRSNYESPDSRVAVGIISAKAVSGTPAVLFQEE